MFQRHGGISFRVQGKSCGFWCGCFWLWLRPLSAFALLFLLLAKRRSGREICVSSLLFLVSGWFLICQEIVEPRCFIMFVICLPASLNVRTEPQSEIGRNRGKKQLYSSSFCFTIALAYGVMLSHCHSSLLNWWEF